MLKNTGTTVRRERNTKLQSHHFSCRLNSLLFSPQPVISDHGLLTTVAYKLGKDDPACYALEVRNCIVLSCLNRPADMLKPLPGFHTSEYLQICLHVWW